jgi:HD superfamily phosphohydrolase YqeK
MKFYLADENNGIFEKYDTQEEAEAAYEKWLAHGIACEKDIQEESGLSDEEIIVKVRNFYAIIQK